MNVCVMDSPELKELYNSVKDTGESYESIKNLVNVWQLRKFNRNKEFDFTELPTKQDIENLLKERNVPNIDSAFVQEYSQEMKDILANAPRDEQGRLLAPNGKLSNLTERQYAQVRTKAFKEWFGDWENDTANASKVVDENGEPLVVYHGSPEIFNSFNINKNTKGHYTYNKEIIPFDSERAIFFSSNPITAKSYVLSKKGIHSTTIQNKLQPVDYYYRAIKELQSLRYDNYSRKSEEEIEYAILWSKKENFNKYKDSLPRYNSIRIRDGRLVLIDFSNKEHEIPSDAKDALITDLKKFLEEKIEISTQEQTDWDGNLISATNLKEGVYPVFLNIKNPLSFDYENLEYSGKYKDKYPVPFINARQVNKAINDGNDGVIYQNIYDPYIGDSYGVFDPNQIKSATDNIGTFSIDDNNIYKHLLHKDIISEKDYIDFLTEFELNRDKTENFLYNFITKILQVNPRNKRDKSIPLTAENYPTPNKIFTNYRTEGAFINNILGLFADFSFDSETFEKDVKDYIENKWEKDLYEELIKLDKEKLSILDSLYKEKVKTQHNISLLQDYLRYRENSSKEALEYIETFKTTKRKTTSLAQHIGYELKKKKSELIDLDERIKHYNFSNASRTLKVKNRLAALYNIENAKELVFNRIKAERDSYKLPKKEWDEKIAPYMSLYEKAKKASKNAELLEYNNPIFENKKSLDEISVNELYNKLIQLNPEMKSFLEFIKLVNPKLKIKVYDTEDYNTLVEREDSYISGQSASIFFPKKNEVAFRLNADTPTILHELLHSVSSYGLIGSSEEQKALGKNVIQPFIDYIDNYLKQNVGNFGSYSIFGAKMPATIYGLTNPAEFIAELFSNKDFQELLDAIPPMEKKQYNSLLEEIINSILNFIKNIFAPKTNETALDQAIQLSLAVIRTQYENIDEIYEQLSNIEDTTQKQILDKQEDKQIVYTPIGKTQQTYTIRKSEDGQYQIINKDGKEVFKEDSKDRRRIFANLAVQEKRAVVVEHKGNKYVVNGRNEIISVATGDLMKWGDENGDRKDILESAKTKFDKLKAQQSVQWAVTSDNNYEVSSAGDSRFSAFNAKLKPGTKILGIEVPEEKETTIAGKPTTTNSIEYVYQTLIKKSGKGQAPSKDSKLFINTTPKFRGQMSFAFGNQRANGVTATTTLEAIKRGERTATTRYTSDGNIDYWKQAKVGDVIEFSGQNGEKVLVRVTKELHQLPKSTTAEEWSSKEGWDTSRFEQRVKPQIDKGEAYQMEFEYIDQSKEALEDFSYREGYLPLWQEWARQNPELIEDLRTKSAGKVLTDKFADKTRVSQARALADILNSTNTQQPQQPQPQQTPIPENLKETPETVAQDINKEEQSSYVKRDVKAEIIDQLAEEVKDFGSYTRRQDRVNLILRFIRNQKKALFNKHKKYLEEKIADTNTSEEHKEEFRQQLNKLDADQLFIDNINNIIPMVKTALSPETVSRLMIKTILEKQIPNFNSLSEEERNRRIEDDYNYRIQEYTKIQKHWDSLIDDVKSTLRVVDGIIIDYVNPNESDVDNANEEEGTVKDNWMYEARKTDQRESLSKKVKTMISNIPILDRNGNKEFDDLGYARYMDAEEVASTLFYELSNSRSCEHFWKKFNELPNKKPWTKIIVNTINKEGNYEIKSQFYQNFRKESIPYWSQIWTKKGVIKTKQINKGGKNSQLLEDWKDNIESGNTLTTNSIYGENGKPNVENAEKNIEILNKLIIDFRSKGNKIGNTQNLKTLIDLIQSIGIEISEEELTSSIANNVKKTENIFDALLTIFKKVSDGKTILATKVNEILVYDSIVEKLNKQYNILATAIDFDVKNAELQSFRELGDTYQSVSAPSYLGTLINNLRNIDNEEEFKQFFEREFGQYSQFKDKETGRIKNDWLNILYHNIKERQNLERKVVLHANRKEFNKQTPEEYLLGMLVEFLQKDPNYAYYALPLLSDADSEEFIKFIRYQDKTDENGRTISFKRIINEKLAQVILDEYERISMVKSRLAANAKTITTFDKNGTKFQYIPELNDITVNAEGEIAGNGENKKLVDAIFDLIEAKQDALPFITKVLEQVMERNAKDFIEETLKITSIDTISSKLNMNKDSIDKFLNNFFYNYTLASINMIQLLTTDVAYYKNTVDFYKRFKEVYASTLKLDTTAEFLGDEGKPVKGSKTQSVMILTDNVVKSPSFDVVKSILEGRVEAGAIAIKQMNDLLDAYKHVNVADAQGYRTLKSYRKLMVMAGRWNRKLERSYQRLEHGIFDYEDFSCIYNTIKPFCYSQRPVASEVITKDDKGNIVSEYGNLKVPIQIKDSEAVLLAMYTTLVSPLNQSERLVGLNKFMKDNDIDIVVFESGVKVGGQGVVNLNNVEGNTYEALEEAVFVGKDLKEKREKKEKNPFIIHNISTEDFGIQVETPDHLVDVEQLIGSQIKKLIQGDIDVNNTGTVTFRLNEGIKGRERKVTKEEFLKHFNNLLSADIIDSFEELRKEFSSLDRVAETLQRELKGNSRYTKDLIIACSLVESTDQIGNVIRDFALPLNDATQFSRIENLLTSLFKNQVIKQKMRGGSPIQFSCYGVSDDLHIEMTGEGAERRVKWIDCYMPAYTKEFFKHYMTTDKNGNQFVDINKVPEELKRLVGYRVPTEARYSMLPLRIKGFLPSSEGSKIMLPADITTIAGSDFDVDKLYVLLPTFYTGITYDYNKFANEYKSILSVNEKTEEEKYRIIKSALNKERESKTLNELEQRIVDEFNNTKDSYKETKLKYVKYDYTKSEKENSRDARHNELISCIFSVLTNEDSADKLLTPGGFDIAKKASYICNILNSGKTSIEKILNRKINSYNDAVDSYYKLLNMNLKELGDYNAELSAGKGVTNPITQVKIHDQNATGGALIGVYANHNVAHSMFQNIKDQWPDSNLPYISTKPQMNGSVIFNGNSYSDLTRVKNYEGHLITTNIANFLAASVDNAKDPVLKALMQNNTTANVTCLMLRLGIEPMIIGLFLNQPIIKEVIDLVNLGNSVGNAISQTYVKYGDLVENAKTKRDYGNSYDSDLAANLIYAESGMKNGDFVVYQFSVLSKFSFLYGVGDYLGRYTNVNKADTQNGAAGPSIAEAINKLAEIDQFNSGILKDDIRILDGKKPISPVLFLPKIGSSENFIGDATEYGILNIPHLLGDYLPYFSNNISSLILSFYEIKEDNKSSDELETVRLNDKTVADVIKELTLYTYSRYVKKPLEYYLNDYLNKFIELKKKYPELSENLFFKRLKLTQPLLKDGVQLRVLQFSNVGSLSKLQKEQISMSWEMLSKSDNAEIRTFMKELFEYFFYVGGFNFNSINPSYLTPISDKMENENYVNSLKYIDKMSDIEHGTFINQFIRHHLNSFAIDVSDRIDQIPLLDEKNEPFKFNISQVPEMFILPKGAWLPRYIKILKDNKVVYYQADYKFRSLYKHIKPLGITGKVFEYNILNPSEEGSLRDIKQSLNLQDLEPASAQEDTKSAPKEDFSMPDEHEIRELRQSANMAKGNNSKPQSSSESLKDFNSIPEAIDEVNNLPICGPTL